MSEFLGRVSKKDIKTETNGGSPYVAVDMLFDAKTERNMYDSARARVVLLGAMQRMLSLQRGV